MGMRLKAGRLLTDADDEKAPMAVVVNDAAAKQFFGGRDPLTVRIRFGGTDPTVKRWINVVGVVQGVRQRSIGLEPRPEIFLPYSQNVSGIGEVFYPTDLAVRVNGEPKNFAEEVRKAIWQVNPEQPIAKVMPMREIVDSDMASRDIQLKLFASFGVVSLLLSALGLYGLLAFTVTQRTQETGVRMALGAQRGDIVRLYLREGLKIVLVGAGIGLVGSLITHQAMRSVLFGVSDSGVTAMAVGIVTLTMTALAAIYIPARRAAATEPMQALRNE
jgi:putative ABC transport system permease protein